jgi:hypothetical protein
MIESILDQCLEDIRGKRATMAECLAKYPEYARELKPLLEMALAIGEIPEIAPSAEFRREMRERLLQRPKPDAPRFDGRADRSSAFDKDPSEIQPISRRAKVDL